MQRQVPLFLPFQLHVVHWHLHINGMAGVSNSAPNAPMPSSSSTPYHSSLLLFIGLTRYNLSNSIGETWKIIGPSGKYSRCLPKSAHVSGGAGSRHEHQLRDPELLLAAVQGPWAHVGCSTRSCTQGTQKMAATAQQQLPDLNFLSGEKSRSSGKCLRRKFVSLQTGSQEDRQLSRVLE